MKKRIKNIDSIFLVCLSLSLVNVIASFAAFFRDKQLGWLAAAFAWLAVLTVLVKENQFKNK